MQRKFTLHNCRRAFGLLRPWAGVASELRCCSSSAEQFTVPNGAGSDSRGMTAHGALPDPHLNSRHNDMTSDVAKLPLALEWAV
jgi:hypothetical protein